ncbi:BON domain-containing protein [Devosia nitrariae]|uniref:BON domain-containing protein n=1 Tax=Devosia nitrariae TaxID=2071872 RepID=A0ABQ5W915_9HYPH|nr:BON domain-containing protein [Devosia nitrariae]GLQ56582.1 BON domain-containing protein [Devosia nitrariae]
MKDSILRQSIMDELEFEPYIDANDIGVAVEDGVVTLTGHVPNYGQKQAVERAVARIKGVRAIAQEMQVRPPGTPGVSDDEIAKHVVNTLRFSTLVPADKVHVRVQQGWVTLTGNLEWNYQKTAAADAVRDIRGVKGVDNSITLSRRPTSLDVKKHIEDALKRYAELEAEKIKVEVVGNTVTLRGTVRALSERSAAEDAAWATPGVHSVDDRLTVS